MTRVLYLIRKWISNVTIISRETTRKIKSKTQKLKYHQMQKMMDDSVCTDHDGHLRVCETRNLCLQVLFFWNHLEKRIQKTVVHSFRCCHHDISCNCARPCVFYAFRVRAYYVRVRGVTTFSLTWVKQKLHITRQILYQISYFLIDFFLHIILVLFFIQWPVNFFITTIFYFF